MTDVTDRSTDQLTNLSAYRPTDAMVDAEWSPAARAEALAVIIGAPSATGDATDSTGAAPVTRLRFVARRSGRRRTFAVPLAASLVVGLVGVVLVFVVRGRSDVGDALGPGGPVYTAPNNTPTPRVGPGQYSLRVTTAYAVRADGSRTATPTQTDEDWIAPDGTIWSYRSSSGHGADCYVFRSSGSASFESPDQAFFDKLPTDPDDLRDYVRGHVSGSTSNDEAVFVAVGDMLRTADGLASEKLRAALVTVLSRTGGVAVHDGVQDARGRDAVRADFVDEVKRPGQIVSLYFAAGTYRLLEERDGTTTVAQPPEGVGTASGAPAGHGSPAGGIGSPAYTRHPGGGASPVRLTGPANIDVLTSETVVDSLPSKVTAASCEQD